MKLLFTICARAGSKGVKNKNIKEFLGYPIVYYTLSVYRLFCVRFGKEYENLDLAINTDSIELVEQAARTNIAFVHIPRKQELAGDVVSKTDVIKDTVKVMEKINSVQYDYIIDLDLTSPLRGVEDIRGVINTLISNQHAQVCFSATNPRRLPFFNMVARNEEGFYFPLINKGYISRQQAPECFDMNASIYAYQREFIISEHTNKIFDGKALLWLMKDTAVLDIDCEEDMELMQVLAQYFYSKYDEMGEIHREIGQLFQK
ncbi:MAG: acylneuraminate cytidylyltransferase [Herbinix sp.]|nr:acylneuraminate cytidylyltransferase [Herbinix sp.]